MTEGSGSFLCFPDRVLFSRLVFIFLDTGGVCCYVGSDDLEHIVRHFHCGGIVLKTLVALFGALILVASCSRYPTPEESGLYYYTQDGTIFKLRTVDFSRFKKSSFGISRWIREQFPLTIRQERPVFILFLVGKDAPLVGSSFQPILNKLNLLEVPPAGVQEDAEEQIGAAIAPISDLHQKLLPSFAARFFPQNKFSLTIEGSLKHSYYYSIYLGQPYWIGWNFKVELPSPRISPQVKRHRQAGKQAKSRQEPPPIPE